MNRLFHFLAAVALDVLYDGQEVTLSVGQLIHDWRSIWTLDRGELGHLTKELR